MALPDDTVLDRENRETMQLISLVAGLVLEAAGLTSIDVDPSRLPSLVDRVHREYLPDGIVRLTVR